MARIFISYRRSDTAGHAGRLRDDLARRFGAGNVFMDIESIEAGADFAQVIERSIGELDAMLVLIGSQWLSAETDGVRRLDDPGDFVRMEVAHGLQRDARVIPVLVQGARMPGPNHLPEPLAGLSRRNAIELSDTRWQYDVDRLTTTLRRVLAATDEAAAALPEYPSPPPLTASALAQVSLGALRANLLWFLLVAGGSGLASSLLVVLGATLLRAGAVATGWEVVVTVLFSSLTYAALVVLAKHSLLGLPADGVTAVRSALDQALPVLVTFLALVLAVGVLSATLLGLPVAILLLVRWAFCLQLVVIEGKDLRSAFTGSAALVKGSWRRVALVLLVTYAAMLLLQILLVIAAGLPVGVFGGMLRLPPVDLPLWSAFVGSVLADLVALPLVAVVQTALYYDLRRAAATES